MTLQIGDSAPDFNSTIESGETKKLKDYKGKKLVLYFYPKDNTSGCTAEACNLRDNFAEFRKRGIEILGVSPDSETSHQKFIAKHDLPFSLLVDTDHKLATDYGVWKEKSMYGRKYFGIVRTTFIIDEKGKIENIIEKVNTKAHAEQIL